MEQEPQTLQGAVVYFANPDNCRNYLVARRWPNGVICPRCGSDKVVFLQVTSRPRKKKEKVAFYKLLCAELAQACGIAPSDVVVSLVENSDEDWSFGQGRAQFLEGDL